MAASKIQPNMGIWHLIAGIVIAVLGVYVWFNPAATLLGLALYLGIIFIVVGAGYFMLSFSNRSGWYLTVGILDMLVGVIFVGNLGLTAATLPIVLALWFLAIGVMQIVASFSLRREGYSWVGRCWPAFWACCLPSLFWLIRPSAPLPLPRWSAHISSCMALLKSANTFPTAV